MQSAKLELIKILRQTLPISIKLAKEVLLLTDNNIELALEKAKYLLLRELMDATDLDYEHCLKRLEYCNYDLDKAKEKYDAEQSTALFHYRRDLTNNLTEFERGIELAQTRKALPIKGCEEEFLLTVHFIPSCILPFELRLFRHKAYYTLEHWGLDDDKAMYDNTTRLQCVKVYNQDELQSWLAHWGFNSTEWKHPLELNNVFLEDDILRFFDSSNHENHLKHLFLPILDIDNG